MIAQNQIFINTEINDVNKVFLWNIGHDVPFLFLVVHMAKKNTTYRFKSRHRQ